MLIFEQKFYGLSLGLSVEIHWNSLRAVAIRVYRFTKLRTKNTIKIIFI